MSRGEKIYHGRTRNELERLWIHLDVINYSIKEQFNKFKQEGCSTDAAARFVAEDLFINHRCKITAKQVYNRVQYLKTRAKVNQARNKVNDLTRTSNQKSDVTIIPTSNKPGLVLKTSPYGVFSSSLIDKKEQPLNFCTFVYEMIDSKKFYHSVNSLCRIYNCRKHLHKDKLDVNRVIDELALFFNVDKNTLRARYRRAEKSLQQEAKNKPSIEENKKKIEELTHQVKSLEEAINVVNMSKKGYEDRNNELGSTIHYMRTKLPITTFILNRAYDLLTLRFPIIKKLWRRETWR